MLSGTGACFHASTATLLESNHTMHHTNEFTRYLKHPTCYMIYISSTFRRFDALSNRPITAVSPPCSITLDGNNLLTAEEIFAWPFYIKSPTIRLLYRPNHYVYLSPRENSVLSTSINTISLGQVPPNLRHSLSTVPSQSGTPFQPASQKLRHWPALNPSWPNLRDLAPRPLPPTRNTLVSAILYLEVSADYYSRSRSSTGWMISTNYFHCFNHVTHG